MVRCCSLGVCWREIRQMRLRDLVKGSRVASDDDDETRRSW